MTNGIGIELPFTVPYPIKHMVIVFDGSVDKVEDINWWEILPICLLDSGVSHNFFSVNWCK